MAAMITKETITTLVTTSSQRIVMIGMSHDAQFFTYDADACMPKK